MRHGIPVWHGQAMPAGRQAQRGHVDAVVRVAENMPAPAGGGLGHGTHFAGEGGTGNPRLPVGHVEALRRGTGKPALTRGTRARVLLAAILLLALSLAGTAQGQSADGSIVGWGWQVVVSQGALDNLVAVAGGSWHSLGLKSDGSIVAWGWNDSGQCNVPAPNADFVGIAGGGYHNLGLKGIFGDFDVDGDVDLSDFDVLIGCLSGPGVRAPLGCARASLDGDVDVDLADFALFQAHFGEAG